MLAIDQTVEDKNGQKVVIGKTATLELQPAQAETLALCAQLGTLSLALRSLVDIGEGRRRGTRNETTASAPRREHGALRRVSTTTTK